MQCITLRKHLPLCSGRTDSCSDAACPGRKLTTGELAVFTRSSRISVEAGIMDMLTRMRSGRFKVFKHLIDWFEEFRLYHRQNGKVHKVNDDMMSATRYAVMMLRYARTDVRST